MSSSVIKDLSSSILFVMWFMTYKRCLTRKYPLAVTWAAELATIPLLYLSTTLLPDLSAARTTIGILPVFLPPLFLYKDKLWKRISVLSVNLIVMVAAEFFCAIVFLKSSSDPMEAMASIANTSEIFVFACYLSLNAMLLSISTGAMRHFVLKNTEGVTSSGEMLFLLFPISQYLLLVLSVRLFDYTSFANTAPYLFAIALCITVDVVLYNVIRRNTQNARLQAEKELLAEQIDAQNEYYSVITHQYENMSRMRHDISNHLYTIRALLKDGKAADAEEYAADVQNRNEFSSSLGQCMNPVVDAFIFHRVEELSARGIETDADIRLPKQTGVKNSELICVFGNLLDNAEEACMAAERKFIRITAAMKGGYLIIKTENSFVPDAKQEKKRRIPELERGLGAHILENAAQSHGGEYKTETEGEVFRACLILKGEAGYA